MGKENEIAEPEQVNHLKFWNKVKTPPKDALKKIRGGRLKGMTDINPTWRIMAMTEHFGPCGIGWKWEPVKKWTETGSGDQVVVFVDINLYIHDDQGWSDPIPGTGGSKLVVKESSGLYTDDEAYKKATTDALTTAMKMLGVAADIYMGNDDGSKYQQPAGVKKPLMNKAQSDKFISFCTDQKLNPTEVAIQYGITKRMEMESFENVFTTIKNHVESGDLGFKFSIPEGEEDEPFTGE